MNNDTVVKKSVYCVIERPDNEKLIQSYEVSVGDKTTVNDVINELSEKIFDAEESESGRYKKVFSNVMLGRRGLKKFSPEDLLKNLEVGGSWMLSMTLSGEEKQ